MPHSRNLVAPWILYEAGALSKAISDKTRLCTYLLCGLPFQDVKPPLGMFQATKPEKVDTQKLVHTINKAVSEEPLPVSSLDRTFERMWPDLEEKLKTMPEPEQVVDSTRSVSDMVTEILEILRADANERIQQKNALDSFMKAGPQTFDFSGNRVGHWNANLATELALAKPRNRYYVKLAYDDKVKEVTGTQAIEAQPGNVIVFDDDNVGARFTNVERWWTEKPN
jgi:hypothetical protein